MELLEGGYSVAVWCLEGICMKKHNGIFLVSPSSHQAHQVSPLVVGHCRSLVARAARRPFCIVSLQSVNNDDAPQDTTFLLSPNYPFSTLPAVKYWVFENFNYVDKSTFIPVLPHSVFVKVCVEHDHKSYFSSVVKKGVVDKVLPRNQKPDGDGNVPLRFSSYTHPRTLAYRGGPKP